MSSSDHSLSVEAPETSSEVSRLKRRIVALEREVKETTGLRSKKAPYVSISLFFPDNLMSIEELISLWDEEFAVLSHCLNLLMPLLLKLITVFNLNLNSLTLIPKSK